MTIYREQAKDMADAHAEGWHTPPEGLPREGCPECEGRDLRDYPPMPTNATAPRKWTAEVSVAGQDVTSMLELPLGTDTLAATTQAAVALATRLIRDELGSDASVWLFKQRRDDAEPIRDRAVYVYRDDNGAVRTQR
jgi:hypothetical protein